MWDTDGGVYFGYGVDHTELAEGEKEPRYGDEIRYVGDRHLITIGPNGSGKSRRVLLPNLAQLKDWSVVVIDPKGDLFQMAGRHRDPRLKNTLLLNPFGALDKGSHGFNPIAALELDDDFPDNALGLAESIIRVEGREPHWAASAQDLVAALIMFSRLSQRDRGSFGHVREMLTRSREDFKVLIARMTACADREGWPELENKAGRFADIDPDSRELHAILSTALTQTRWLDSRPITADLEQSTPFDFAALKEHPTSVWLILPARRLGTHSTWLRLMIASIVQPLMRDTRKSKVPVLLMLDEYPALARGGFSIIEDNMAMFRGYGIKLWTVWQDLGQANKLYGSSYESFVANAGVLHSFAPQDVLTAEFLSKRMPLMAMSTEGQTHNFGGEKSGGATHSMNAGYQGMPLVQPQHLRNMDEGFAVIFSHKAKGPMRSYFPWKVEGHDEVYARDQS